MPQTFNNQLRQLVLLAAIVLIAVVLLKQLYVFLPGFLGAVTLYILFRASYFRISAQKKWKKFPVALMFVLLSLLLIAVPMYFFIQLVYVKLSMLMGHVSEIQQKAIIVGRELNEWLGMDLLSRSHIEKGQAQLAAFIPLVINSSVGILSNFVVMFFLLFFLLKEGRKMESFLSRQLPLKTENILLLARETKNMITASAIGIPVLAAVQGLIATLGYALFGVEDYGMWGFFTGVCSLIPVIGTAIIWMPLCAYFFAIGQQAAGWGLLIYSAVLITNIDYLVRLTILKKFINTHALVTIFGVITGVPLFGFWGVIFGPLLISYFIISVKIYLNEFANPA